VVVLLCSAGPLDPKTAATDMTDRVPSPGPRLILAAPSPDLRAGLPEAGIRRDGIGQWARAILLGKIMSFSFSSMIRLLVLLALGTTMLAVGLSRLDPPAPGWRTRRVIRDYNINEYFIEATDRTPRWLDSETGRVTGSPLVDGDVLEAASSSPWVDEQGRRHVIGRWSRRTKNGPLSVSEDFGLARYTLPGGEPLDQVSTEIVPVSPPCWFPGTRARVVFTAGDGMLYHYAFEAEGRPKAGAGPDGGRDARPIPMAWRCPVPGGGRFFIGDVTWPDDPRMGGCLLVALRHQGPEADGPRGFSPTELWWLKLNHAGTAIVEAGRLIHPDQSVSSGGPCEERSPVVSTLPDGIIILGYLSQRTGETGWQLRVGTIAIDPDRRIPSLLGSSTRALADRCQSANPAFSPDGRWLNAIVGGPHAECRIVRVRTVGAITDPVSPAPRS